MDQAVSALEPLLSPVIGLVNLVLWEYVLVYGLLAVGLWFTVRLGGLQFRRFGHMWRVIGRGTGGDDAGISPFQALATSLASRVGTGNLAGVAIALGLGGPGALFWMWCVAVVGMATAYARVRWRSCTRCATTRASTAAARATTWRAGWGCRGWAWRSRCAWCSRTG
jgi:alanine or glycine:cation symporter, AGCS family